MISQKEEGKKDSTSERSTGGFILICNALLLKLVDGYMGGHSLTLQLSVCLKYFKINVLRIINLKLKEISDSESKNLISEYK